MAMVMAANKNFQSNMIKFISAIVGVSMEIVMFKSLDHRRWFLLLLLSIQMELNNVDISLEEEKNECAANEKHSALQNVRIVVHYGWQMMHYCVISSKLRHNEKYSLTARPIMVVCIDLCWPFVLQSYKSHKHNGHSGLLLEFVN